MRKEIRWEVEAEMARARKLFPSSSNLTLAMAEEAGEAVKAALDAHCCIRDNVSMTDGTTVSHANGCLRALRKELIQTMAMCARLLEEGDEKQGIPAIVAPPGDAE